MDSKRVTQVIIDWLQEQLKRSNQKSFIVGVSGGVDSGLVSTLCALTSKPTHCIHMPIHSNNNELAMEHMNWLTEKWPNVQAHVINLSDSCSYMQEHIYGALEAFSIQGSKLDLIDANVRSRLRMIALYGYANAFDSLVVGTGNKIEDYGIGFFTKYGDGGVDISPIGDLLKSEVKELAKSLDVNEKIVNAIPTDGLWWDSRNDEQQIGASYDELELAMDRYESKKMFENLTERDNEVDQIYLERHLKNRHKMKMPPICKIK